MAVSAILFFMHVSLILNGRVYRAAPGGGGALLQRESLGYLAAGLFQSVAPVVEVDATEYSAPGALRVFWKSSSDWPRMAA
jgi:hypothetical protein